MKKLISLTLAIIVILSLAVPAMATQTWSSTTNSTTLTATVDGHYTVKIPITVAFSSDTATLGVSLTSDSQLYNGETITVSVPTADGELALQGGGTDKITYKATTASVELKAAGATGNVVLAMNDTSSATAGSYQGSIVFTVATDHTSN